MHKHTNQSQKDKGRLKVDQGYARIHPRCGCGVRQGFVVLVDALGVGRGTVGDWLDAYDRYGLDGPAGAARPGRPLSRRATT